jgi:GMP synthase (glutamine-hydrolysing)
MRPLLCVRHQESAPLGIIEDVLSETGLDWRYLDVWGKAEAVPRAADISGLIVLGGEMNADDLDSYPFLRSVRTLMEEAVRAELPVLGVCLGAQILTRAMGAVVTPSPIREIGFLAVKATEAGMSDAVLEPFAPESSVFQFHEDECELPAAAELLFEGETVAVQAFRVGERAYGVQFHFEVTRGVIADWCDETPDLEQTWGTSKSDILDEAGEHLESQQRAGKEATRRFLSIVGR